MTKAPARKNIHSPNHYGGSPGTGVPHRVIGGHKKKSKPMTAAQYHKFLHYLRTHPQKKKNRVGKTRGFSLNGGGTAVKFGRNRPYTKAERPRLVLEDYRTSYDAGIFPIVVDRASKVTAWPMYGNDSIGDCTCATVGHEIQAWTAYAGTEVTIPESSVIELYSAVSGYDPVTGANDNGAVIQDVLQYWHRHGVNGDPHRVLAYAQVENLSSEVDIRQVLDWFGTVYIGLSVPQSAMDQFNSGEPWTYVPGSPIEGGHAVPVQLSNKDSGFPVTVVTWGQLQEMNWEFWNQYVEEAWVIITDDWLRANGTAPPGLNLQKLGADFQAMTGRPNPFPSPAAESGSESLSGPSGG